MATKKQKTTTSKKPVFKLKSWHYILLVLLPAIVYGRSVMFDYVMHDDDKMILENPMLEQGLDFNIAFTTDAWFMDARIELYRPWQSITYMIDHSIGGNDPTVYHVHNLIIFILGAVLLFYFLQYYFKPLLAWAGTLLYSINLLTPHAVGWIAARGDLYLMVFGLFCLIMLQKFLRTGSSKFIWLSLVFFLLALLSKESAVALIPIGAVLLYADKKRWPGSIAWIWLGACAVVFAGYYALRAKSIADAGNLSAQAFFQNIRSIPEEFFKMLIPVGFSVMPGYSLIWTLLGTVMLAAFIYFIWKYKPEQRILMTGAALCLALLLPSMLYEPSFAGVAYDYLDHRAWLPFTGIWMIILGIVDKLKFSSHKAAPAVFFSILIIWSGINFWRIGTYDNWEAYYSNAIKTNPGSGLANLNYGSMLRDEGKWQDALPYIEKGVELSPDYADAKVRLAEAYFNLQRYDDAIAISGKVLEKEPKNISALQFRGSSYGASGNTEAAAKDFKLILETEPDNLHGLFNLGVAYKEANMLNEAIETFSLLISKNPDFPNAYFERGFAYGKMGLFPQAKFDMDQSIRNQPEHGPSYFFRGRAFESVGNISAACSDWRKAAQLGLKEAEQYVQQKCAGQ
ncbi:MAG TPA: tetratricopeptide repeat protein [Saprospiraceae bacterium]|nr:tetratricopeptide repeat protein [Saprospiraceae bacterium]